MLNVQSIRIHKDFVPLINLLMLSVLSLVFLPFLASGQYCPVSHREPDKDEIPVSSPGNYGKPGTTYILVNDISSPVSSVFLGKDVTLDLNGYTLRFADGDYEHIPNYSFEEGLKGWDYSKAPSATIEDTKVHVFAGDKVLRLSKGEELVSPYIYLPVPNRSYLAMCGVARYDMKVSVYVEDETGESVICNTTYSDGVKQSCPVENRSPRLGGGFVYAHLSDLKAGKYRIRVRAETDCLVDHIDIRPAMDTGIGIVEQTFPTGHNDHFYERGQSAFFDYTEDVSSARPVAGIPQVSGKGTVTIRNGIIVNGTEGAISRGIQSTAGEVHIVLDNVKIINSGINATAVDVPQATITNCTFDVRNPFIINRHGSEFYAVDLRGDQSSEVSFSEFFGGQGCLVFKGNHSSVHHNHFENRQTITNHYSIMAMGDSSKIYANHIEPETGSGIEVYVHRGMEIFDNMIRITASPPTSEYGHEEYSVAAIRLADYNAKPGSPRGCFGNKVYNNKIFITGKDYPAYKDYIPMAWAVFYSASGGNNLIFGNDIRVEDLTPGLKNETSAFYIGGGTIGGSFFDNRITTNVSAAWVASRYGGARNTRLFNNIIIKAGSTENNSYPFRMGWDRREDCIAEDVVFLSNKLEGFRFGINTSDQAHSYSVWWTLTIKVTDEEGKPVSDLPVRILNKDGKEIVLQNTNEQGDLQLELKEYTVKNKEQFTENPYTIEVGTKRNKIKLNKDTEIKLVI